MPTAASSPCSASPTVNLHSLTVFFWGWRAQVAGLEIEQEVGPRAGAIDGPLYHGAEDRLRFRPFLRCRNRLVLSLVVQIRQPKIAYKRLVLEQNQRQQH